MANESQEPDRIIIGSWRPGGREILARPQSEINRVNTPPRRIYLSLSRSLTRLPLPPYHVLSLAVARCSRRRESCLQPDTRNIGSHLRFMDGSSARCYPWLSPMGHGILKISQLDRSADAARVLPFNFLQLAARRGVVRLAQFSPAVGHRSSKLVMRVRFPSPALLVLDSGQVSTLTYWMLMTS